MAPSAKLKIFCDLDGTLIDVSDRHYKVYSEVISNLGGIPLTKFSYWEQKRSKVEWPELLIQSQLSKETESIFIEEFIKIIERPDYLKLDRLFPSVLTLLKRLNAQYDCYLVSLRRNKANLMDELTSLGLLTLFGEILTGHSNSDGVDVKTSLIAGISNSNDDVAIGDTEADILAGQKIGIKTIAVSSGIRDDIFLRELQPNYLVARFSEIRSLLLSES